MVGSRELVAASSTPLVLAILSQGESYGYAIIQEVRERSGGALQFTDGMLYPVLHRLEREGLISSRWRVSEVGRKRKYYRLNEKGRKAQAEHRAHWLAVHDTLITLWGATS